MTHCTIPVLCKSVNAGDGCDLRVAKAWALDKQEQQGTDTQKATAPG